MPLLDQPDTPELVDFQASFIGGANSSKRPHLLEPSEASYLLNTNLALDGRVQKAPGITKKGPANFDLEPFASNLSHGLFNFRDFSKSLRLLFGRWGNDIYSLNDTDDPSFPNVEFRWNRRICSVSFTDTGYMGVQGIASGNITTLFLTACVSLSESAGSFSRLSYVDENFNGALHTQANFPRCLTWFQSRLWTADSKTVYWSKLNSGWSAYANSFVVGSADDDDNVALMPLRDPTPRMLIFRRHSVYLLDIFWQTDGYFPITSDTMDFTKGLVRPIVQETGLVAPRAVTWVPGLQGQFTGGDYLFLSEDGIRSLSRSATDSQGGATTPLSWKIQNLIDRINWAYAVNATAVYHKGLVYFSIPIDGSTRNNHTLVYDPQWDHWYSRDWGSEGFARLRFPAKDTHLYFQSAVAVRESYTNPSFQMLQGHVYDTSTGIGGFDGGAVDMDMELRGLSFDLAEPRGSGFRERKRWGYADVGLNAAGTACTLTFSYRLNGGSSWSAFANLSVLPQSGLQRRKLDLGRIPPGYTIQFRLRDNSSFGTPEITHFRISAYPFPETFA